MTNTSRILLDMTSMINDHLAISETAQIKTPSVEINFVRNNITNLDKFINIQGSRISLPSFCEMIANNDSCESTIIRQQVISKINKIIEIQFGYKIK